MDRPSESDADDVDQAELPSTHRLTTEISAAGFQGKYGVAILIEGCAFADAAARFFSRRAVESYCDWFTVIGDVRAGLFKSREAFHEAITTQSRDWQAILPNQVPIRPITVLLAINGESTYQPIGLASGPRNQDFLQAWPEDKKRYQKQPGVLSLGHRFADHHESQVAGTARRVRDDLTSLCLLDPQSFGDDPEFQVVMRIEGHRRQRETYLEAQWQNHPGEYGFEDRFGLWLCRDFVPVLRQNDWLKEAIERAAQKRQRLGRYEIKTLRNWHVFVNHQGLTLTANRNHISNMDLVRERVVSLVAKRIEKVLDEDAFAEWLANLQAAVARGQRDREVRQMEARVDDVDRWFKNNQGVEPAEIDRLTRLDENESLRMRLPQNEQELFYLYAVMSGAFRVPLRVLEYNAREGIDAVAQVIDDALVRQLKRSTARVEFKHEIAANRTVDHYFDAIDVFVCWKVGLIGKLREGGDSTEEGTLRARKTPVTVGSLDTHEVEYTTTKGEKRIIPVVQLAVLFDLAKKRRRR